jgi:hypothetical protein
MVIEVKKASELRVGENFQAKVLIYGPTGTCKTWALRTIPRPAFVIDSDQGELINRGVEGLEYVDIAPDMTLKGGIPSAWDKVKEATRKFIETKDQYKSVCLDSFTTIADAALAKIMFLNQHQITGKTKDEVGVTLPDLNMEKQFAQNLLMELLGTGKHMFCICHETIIKQDISGQIFRLPAARGQLQEKIAIWFDEVYNSRLRMDKEGKYRPMWLVRTDGVYVAKSRLCNSADMDSEQPADCLAYAKLCGVEIK